MSTAIPFDTGIHGRSRRRLPAPHVQETARFLKVIVSWVYEHVRPDAEDRLPVVKLGKYLRFDRRDLRAYIDAKRAASRHAAPPTLTDSALPR